MLKTHQDKVSASATLLTKGPDKVNLFSAQKKPEMEPRHEKKNVINTIVFYYQCLNLIANTIHFLFHDTEWVKWVA